jgi:hypothetical protein
VVDLALDVQRSVSNSSSIVEPGAPIMLSEPRRMPCLLIHVAALMSCWRVVFFL